MLHELCLPNSQCDPNEAIRPVQAIIHPELSPRGRLTVASKEIVPHHRFQLECRLPIWVWVCACSEKRANVLHRM
jgi:hypothetical protein